MNLRIRDLFEVTEFYDLSVIIINEANIITYVNQSACKLFKATKTQLLQQNINSLISLQNNAQQANYLASYESSQINKISGSAKLINLTDLNGNQIALNLMSHGIDLIGSTSYILVFGEDDLPLKNVVLDLFNRIVELKNFIFNPSGNEFSSNNLQFLLDYSLKILNVEYGFVAELGTDLTSNIAALSLKSFAGSNLNSELRANYEIQLQQIDFISVENPLFTEILQTGLPVIMNDFSEQNHFMPPNFISTLNNYLLLPIFNDGRLIGVLLLANREAGFMPEHSYYLQLLVKPIADILTKVIKPASCYDDIDLVTDVQNRNAYIRDFDALLNSPTSESEQLIAMVNINNFKFINAHYSIEDGNRALFSLAARLSVIFGKEHIYRVGNDEFIILIKDYTVAELQPLFNNIGREIKLSSMQVDVVIRCGVVNTRLYKFNAQEILNNLSILLFYARREEVDFVLYDKNLRFSQNVHLVNPRLIESYLLNDCFKLFLQPVVNELGIVIRFEVLSRLVLLGEIYRPSYFLPAIQQHGLVERFDEWVLKNVIKLLQSAFWCEKLQQRRYCFSINISPLSCKFLQHIQNLLDIIQASDLDLNLIQLEFEITEEALIRKETQDKDVFMEVAKLLHSKNITLSIDDFGVEGSSFERLMACNFDVIKVDMSLVSRLLSDGYGGKSSKYIIKSLLNLSIDLGVDLIVEGVANKELFLILRQIGCKIFQGYYFFQPLPSEEVEYLIRKNLLDQFDKVNL